MAKVDTSLHHIACFKSETEDVTIGIQFGSEQSTKLIGKSHSNDACKTTVDLSDVKLMAVDIKPQEEGKSYRVI